MIATINKYLTQQAKVYRPTTTEDEYGGITTTLTLIDTIDARLRQLSENERLSSQRVEHYSTHRLYTRSGIIADTDIIEIGARQYNVIGINDVMSFDALYQIDVELRQ